MPTIRPVVQEFDPAIMLLAFAPEHKMGLAMQILMQGGPPSRSSGSKLVAARPLLEAVKTGIRGPESARCLGGGYRIHRALAEIAEHTPCEMRSSAAPRKQHILDSDPSVNSLEILESD